MASPFTKSTISTSSPSPPLKKNADGLPIPMKTGLFRLNSNSVLAAFRRRITVSGPFVPFTTG